MSSTPATPAIELLLEHAGWIRGLARRLTDDPASADDLEQKTWLAALEHPPKSRGGGAGEAPLRLWLAAIVRNCARQMRRGEGRRLDHERRAARAEALPSAADVVERATVQREVVESVLALDEPYRTAILLRFFEGLAPRAIANELGVPVETVHTRIQRGIARLRERLDAHHGGDRRAWAVALVPLAAASSPIPPLPAWSPTVLGTLLMNAKIVISVAALAAAGLVAVWLVDTDVTAPTPALASAPAAVQSPVPDKIAPEATALSEAEPAAAASKDRTTASAPKPAAPAPVVAPAVAMLRGQVIDVHGDPAALVDIGLDEGRGVKQALAESGPDGRFEITAPANAGRLVTVEDKLATVLAGVYDGGSGKAEPVIVVAPRVALAGRVTGDDGAALQGVAVHVEMPGGFRTRFRRVLDNSVDVPLRTSSDAQGAFRLDGVALVEGATLQAEHDGYEPFQAPLEAASGENVSIALARPPVQEGVVRGKVIDGAGLPVAGARVAFGVASTKSEDDGSFAFPIHDEHSLNAQFGVVPMTLVAVKKGHQPARFEAPTAAGKAVWPQMVVLKLGEPPLSIEGRVVDDKGSPLSDAKVWIADATFFGDGGEGPTHIEPMLAGEADRKRIWYFVETDGDGRFQIKGLLARDYTVRAMDPKTLLRGEDGPVAAGSTDVEIRLPTDALYPRVAGRVVSHSGAPIAKAQVFPMCDAFQARVQGRVFSTSHDALDGVTTDEEGRFELKNVPKNLVYLRVGGEDILPREFGRPGVDEVEGLPKDKIDKLEIAVDRRCHFQVELADPTAADEIAVLDDSGQELIINIFMGNSRSERPRAQIVDGRSHSMAVSDKGKTLVVYKAGQEVTRMPLGLTPGELRRVQL